jgi:hypothetical protein
MELMKHLNIVKSKVKNYKRKIAAPGSPFRLLRKLSLYSAHPYAHLARRRIAAGMKLSDGLAHHVKELKQTGFSFAGEEVDQSLNRELASAVEKKLEGVKIDTSAGVRKNYWQKLIGSNEIGTDSIFARVALQEDIIRVVSSYFGEVPYLSDIEVVMSYGTENKSWQDSQLWHQDYVDTKTVKFWVYLTDVKERSHGPFTLIPAQHSDRVKNAFFRGRITDEEMVRQGQAGHAQEVFGAKYASFYVDTYRCYHQGSRLELGRTRVAYVATYVSHASLYPFANGITQNTELSDLQKHVLTL